MKIISRFLELVEKHIGDNKHNLPTSLQEPPEYPIQLKYRTLINQLQPQLCLYRSIRRYALNQPTGTKF